jgi:hypothetical protein
VRTAPAPDNTGRAVPSPPNPPSTAEERRLADDASRKENWKRWGPYLAERQWGTVREDYSGSGDAWTYFPHEHAHLRAYRWGEDGLLGISDRECRLCFALALWNERDPILKERLFGLSNPQGNHGEDAKECWYYLDSTPTHSYLRGLYKYPQAAYPYKQLVEVNGRRGRTDREYELHETGIFDEQKYFDVFAEYAKASPDDILIRVTIENRAAETARLHVLPTLWFRNTWSWGQTFGSTKTKPSMRLVAPGRVALSHETLGEFVFEVESERPLLFTENETNFQALYGTTNASPCAKDAFHQHVVEGKSSTNLQGGTKCAPQFILELAGGAIQTIELRLRRAGPSLSPAFGPEFDRIFALRRAEADEFYASKVSPYSSPDQRHVLRQAYAGLLWSRQYFGYVVSEWAQGDPAQPAPPDGHARSRNADWAHLHANDVLSMPDKWEYPWFAAWDLAFHMIPMARIEWANAGLRVELQRRQSARPRVGLLARLQDLRSAGRARRPLSRALLPEAALELHLVGQPQGRARPPCLLRRLPRPR